MKNKNLLRALIIPYIAVLIYWTYRQYVFCTELCNCLYLWSIWDTIELNMGFIITFIVITLAVNYAGTHIIRYGKTRELLSSSTKGTIRRVHKWVNRGLNLVLAYFIIAAIIEILDVDAEYGMLRAFFICAAPTLPWIMIQEIINEICKLFVDGIDEEDKEEEEKIEESKDALAISEEGVCQTEEQRETGMTEPQVEQIEEPVVEESVRPVVQEDNGSESIAPQVTIKETSGRKNSSKTIVFGTILLCMALIGILVLRSCSEGDTQGGNSENGDEKETYTIAEYINICEVVSTETIGRNPDAYIGKDVLIEGSIGNTFGVYSIGLWSTSNPITVEYDGTAYNIELNPIGNVLNGDYGFVAGRYIGDNTIRAEIIVVYEDRDNDSYEQILDSDTRVEESNPNIEQEGMHNTESERAEWKAKIITSAEPGDLSVEYNAFSAEISWYINFIFESSISTAQTQASYKIESSNGTVYSGDIDGPILDKDVWSLEVPKNTFEAGEDVYITVYVNGEELCSVSVWMTYY